MTELYNVNTYDFEKVIDVLDIPAVWTPVASLVTPLRAAGTYVLGFSLTWDFSAANGVVMMQWRLNGGLWNIYESEPVSKTSDHTSYYEFPSVYPEQIHTVDVQMMKSVGQGIFNVSFMDIFLQRVN